MLPHNLHSRIQHPGFTSIHYCKHNNYFIHSFYCFLSQHFVSANSSQFPPLSFPLVLFYFLLILPLSYIPEPKYLKKPNTFHFSHAGQHSFHTHHPLTWLLHCSWIYLPITFFSSTTLQHTLTIFCRLSSALAISTASSTYRCLFSSHLQL